MKIKLIIIFMLCMGVSASTPIAIGESLLKSAETDDEGIRNLIKNLDVLVTSKPNKSLIDKSRAIQNWAAKKGTGKTLDELKKDAMLNIEVTWLNTETLNKKLEFNITNISSISNSQVQQAIINWMKNKGHKVTVEKVFTGPFSSVGSIEAIAELDFEDKPYAESHQVWVFRYADNKWVDPGLISEGWAKPIPMDIDGDGVNELLIHASNMHQGYVTVSYTLIKLVLRTKYLVIYESLSEDNTGSLHDGAKLHVEILSFDDIDGDGRKELLVTIVSGSGRFDLTKKCSDKDKIEVFDPESGKHFKACGFDSYKITNIETVTTVYKLKGIIYNKWRQTAVIVGNSE